MNRTEKRPFDYQQAQKEATAWFDAHYREAANALEAVALARGEANPLLREYLERGETKPSKAIVIGCGLGDDAQALHEAGFEVTAIDFSPEVDQVGQSPLRRECDRLQGRGPFRSAARATGAFRLCFRSVHHTVPPPLPAREGDHGHRIADGAQRQAPGRLSCETRRRAL